MVSQADRELIRDFVNELRPYLEMVRVGVQEFAKPDRDGVVVGQAVQALMMVRGAGQILMVDGLVSIAGWMVESLEKTQINPDIEPADALKRLTGLYSALEDYLNALDRGEDPDAIVLRAKTIYEAIPGYAGPVPGVSSQSELSALFDDDSHTAQTARVGNRSIPPLVPGKPAVPARAQAQPTSELPSTQSAAGEVPESPTPVQDAPARIIPPPPQPTDPLPEIDPELREIFEEEALDIVTAFGEGIRELVRAPDNREAIRTLQRAAHTLKGAANMTGFPLIAQIGAALELLFDEQLESSKPVERDVFELLAVSWKMLRSMLPRLDDLSGFTSPSNSIVQRATVLRQELANASAASRPVESARTPSDARIVSIPETDAQTPASEDVTVEPEPASSAKESDASTDVAATPPIAFDPGVQETTRELPGIDARHIEEAPTSQPHQGVLESPPKSVDEPAEKAADDVVDEVESAVFEQAGDSAGKECPAIEPAADLKAAEIEPPAEEHSEGAFWSAGEEDDVVDEQLDSTPFWSPGTESLAPSNADLHPPTFDDDASETFIQPIAESIVDSFFAEADSEAFEPANETRHEWDRPQTDLLNFDDTPQTEPFWKALEEPEPASEAQQQEEEEAEEPVIIDPFLEPVEAEPEFTYDASDDEHESESTAFAYDFETLPVDDDEAEWDTEEVEESAIAGAADAESIAEVAEGLTASVDTNIPTIQEEPDIPFSDEEPEAVADDELSAMPIEDDEPLNIADEILFAFDSRLSELPAQTTVEEKEALAQANDLAPSEDIPAAAVSTDDAVDEVTEEPAAYPFVPEDSKSGNQISASGETAFESKAEEMLPDTDTEEHFEGEPTGGDLTEELEDVVASMADDAAFDDLDWFEQPGDIETDKQTQDRPQGAGLLGAPDAALLSDPATDSPGLGTLDISSFLSTEASIARSVDLLDMAFSSHPGPARAGSLGDRLQIGTATVFDENSDRALEVEMFETFSIEAEEHIAILNRAGMLLDRDPTAAGPLVDTKRALHTIKGAAAAADFGEISDIAHKLEDSLADHEKADTLGDRRFTTDLFAALEDIERKISERKDEIFGTAEDDERGPTVRVDVARVDELLNTVGELVVNRSSFEERLERLESSIEDLSSAATRLQRASYLLDREANAEDAIGRLLRGEMSGRSPLMNITAIQGEWDMLEMDRYTEFDRLIRQLAEIGADVTTAVGEISSLRGDFDTVSTRQGRLTTTLQDELMGIRMVPISSLAPRLYRVVRRAAGRRGKEVNLVIEGGETPFDKTLLDTLSESLLHLLRNAVDHGVEEPDERRRAGKPDLGSIRIRAFRDGSEAIIEIIDDGAGIDHEAVVATAREAGLAVPIDPSREEALALIFTSGFTTRPEADDISGRGLGLEIVQQTVSRFKGRVAVDSILGRGTVFSLRLPVMLSVIQAFLVRAGAGEFAIPVTNVDYVVDRMDQPLTEIGGTVVVETANEIIPVVDVSARVGQAQTPVLERAEGWIMVTEIAGRRWALVVDELQGQQEIVVKPMGRFLRATPGLMGATILGHGDVALIIDVPALLGVDTLSTRLDGIPLGAATGESGPTVVEPEQKNDAPVILIVDDSLSVRRVVSRTIERHGWIPVLARDGIEAIELLGQGQYGAILTDIEMPRMDGFELISTVRGRPEFVDLPVVVLTSRSGQKHRERAIGLGANEYLVKPFQEQELINVIESVSKAHSEV